MKARERFPELWFWLDVKVRGMIVGMEEMGAIFDGIKAPFMLFTIPKGSEIDDDEKLVRAKNAILLITGLTIKIKRK